MVDQQKGAWVLKPENGSQTETRAPDAEEVNQMKNGVLSGLNVEGSKSKKPELCPEWLETGHCHADGCSFAHGNAELKQALALWTAQSVACAAPEAEVLLTTSPTSPTASNSKKPTSSGAGEETSAPSPCIPTSSADEKNGSSAQPPAKTKDEAASDPKYKTALCLRWRKSGSCQLGEKCTFAHGKSELRPPARAPKLAPARIPIQNNRVAESEPPTKPDEAEDETISGEPDDDSGDSIEDCERGAKCWDRKCPLKHPSERHLCKHDVECRLFTCKFLHPPQRRKCCPHAADCVQCSCSLLHPKSRKLCKLGNDCLIYECRDVHPPERPRPCKFGNECKIVTCPFWHPENWKLCPNPTNCADFSCPLLHDSCRPKPCAMGAKCWNPECECLHDPETWNPCEAGSKCEGLKDGSCDKIHPSAPVGANPLATAITKQVRKTETKLPIAEKREEFVARLKTEKVLVVKAHTGSGKTTQLPQFCAETPELTTLSNGEQGLVVCTQPRVIAAITVARRVAEEFDGQGHSPGESVGYMVGGAKTVWGSKIVFMTDAALIREFRDHPQLEHISVLLIDEAHERSLNTDIVLGLAKRTLSKRPNDFHVVIASATIETDPFLKFLNMPTKALEAGKAPHPVTEEFLQADELLAFPPERILRDPLTYVKQLVVPKVLEIMKNHAKGHALVFLPGQAEIETAIREISKKLPDNITPLPLYGSLPPEEQERVMKFDDQKNTMRMVAFCTNVAETSLTVHGVKLVIDSGLCKEARFDQKRKITVLDLQYISVSSANQRKGRAGRECPGHCVRLYCRDSVTRESAVPEIKRCSLDDTVLQLVRIGEDPVSFDFLEHPGHDSIRESLNKLMELNCLDDGMKITRRGELFSELPFEPRYCEFIRQAYELYGCSDSAINIASVLTAPGKIFYMGARNPDDKKKIVEKISSEAARFNSDLVYLEDVFQRWVKAGGVDSGRRCLTCRQKAFENKGCRRCRVKFAASHSLNNKVLECALGSRDQVAKILLKDKWGLAKADLAANISEAIGKSLLAPFRENIGQLLLPNMPSRGAWLVNADVFARFYTECVLLQKSVDCTHFLAMSVTQSSSGHSFAENVHPLRPIEGTVFPELNMIELSPWNNVGAELFHAVQRRLDQLTLEARGSDGWHRFVIGIHKPPNQLVIHAPAAKADTVKENISSVLEKERAVLLDWESDPFPLAGASGSLYLKAGFKVARVDTLRGDYCLTLRNIPCSTKEECKQWLAEQFQLDVEKKKECTRWKFVPNTENGETEGSRCLLFFHKRERALEVELQWKRTDEDEDDDESVESDEEDEAACAGPPPPASGVVGKTWSLSGILSSEQLNVVHCAKEAMQPLSIQETVRRNGSFCIRLANVRGDAARLRRIFDGCGLSYKYDFVIKDITQGDSGTENKFLLVFASSSTEERDNVFDLLEDDSELLRRLGNGFRRPALVAMDACKDRPPQFIVRLVFSSVDSAQTAFDQAQQRWLPLTLRSVLPVEHEDLFPQLNHLAQRAAANNNVDCKQKQLSFPQGGKRARPMIGYEFTGSPKGVADAQSQLRACIQPLYFSYRVKDFKEKMFCEEITKPSKASKIIEWEKLHGLRCFVSHKAHETNIVVHGPGKSQGAFMASAAEARDAFNKRFGLISLNVETTEMLRRPTALASKLRKFMEKKTNTKYSVSYQGIELYLAPPKAKSSNDLGKLKQQVLDFLQNTELVKDYTAKLCKQSCVFCKVETKVACSLDHFKICGHPYCRCCLAGFIQSKNSFPLTCPLCRTAIHIKDLMGSVPPVLRGGIACWTLHQQSTVLKQHRICPNVKCTSLFRVGAGYSECSGCGISVCADCRTVSDNLHRGRSCHDYKFVACPKCRGDIPRGTPYGRCSLCNTDVCGGCGATSDRLHYSCECKEYQVRKQRLRVCPNPKCNGIHDRLKPYSLCDDCRFGVCVTCQVYNEDTLHLGYGCAEFQQRDKKPTICPKCKAQLPRGSLYCPCPACGTEVCLYCDVAADALHRDITCKEYHSKLKQAVRCPSPKCTANIPLGTLYSMCKDCRHHVCIDCKVIDDALHKGRKCTEYQAELAKYDYCPNPCCSQRILKDQPFGKCSGCGRKVCVSCKVADDEHEGYSCQEYKTKKMQPPAYFDILQKFEHWARSNWKLDMPSITLIEVNPGFKNCNSPAYERFKKALTKSTNPAFSFGWHGTQQASIESVCHNGFDPSKRNGQAYGPGEYFADNPTASRHYTKGFNRMILACIVQGPHLKAVSNGIIVVNNPLDWSLSYCAPVAVVSFGPTAPLFTVLLPPVLFSAGLTPVEGGDGNTAAVWDSPFRWMWMDDSRAFKPYLAMVNKLLEVAYENFRFHGGPATLETPPIQRLRDDVPQSYRIDFQSGNQTHPRTGYTRKIQRDKVLVRCHGGKWEVQEISTWCRLDPIDEDHVERAYQSYISGSGKQEFSTKIVGRPDNELYTFDFVNGTQTNNVYGTRRSIRRT